MPIPATYFDSIPPAQSQAEKDVSQGYALVREFERLVRNVQEPLADGTNLTTAQRTALKTFYGTLRTRMQTWFSSLPTP